MPKYRVILAVLFALSGCSGQPVTEVKPATMERLFHDDLFAVTNDFPVAEIFSVNAAMKDFLDKEITPQLRRKNEPRALYDAISKKGRFWLEYDAKRTRTASEAFESRQGNCMSLVIMTSALAKSLGLEVHYQKVWIEDLWSREQDTLILVGHVNIILGDRRWKDPYTRAIESSIVVDFLPLEEARGLRSMEIGEATIVAMFLNNRAAEELTVGRLDAAYGFARRSTQADPTFLGAINTLGVIYRRHGNLPEAEAVFRALLDSTPDNTLVLANLAVTLKDQGRIEESGRFAQRLKELEPVAPFHFLDLAHAAMARGEFATARDLFKRELDRNPGNHEVHFGLARAYLELGDLEAARNHLREAAKTSVSREDQERYSNKLERLRVMSVR
ncbi:MAG: tetratricopeptide repeat protein [Proteobacteria bacterium]|nr:tetratricopeptide repeat protein [Pseudomonadota bacterium]